MKPLLLLVLILISSNVQADDWIFFYPTLFCNLTHHPAHRAHIQFFEIDLIVDERASDGHEVHFNKQGLITGNFSAVYGWDGPLVNYHDLGVRINHNCRDDMWFREVKINFENQCRIGGKACHVYFYAELTNTVSGTWKNYYSRIIQE